jgi:regulator of nucleoside diphosphate kinase
MSSRVTFSVDGRESDTRVISHDRMTPVGLFLPITTARGLALLGLVEGQEFVLTNSQGVEERVLLGKVQYQPEAARREKEALSSPSAPVHRKPALTLIRGALHDQPQLAPAEPDGFDDPGPSAA